jgi:hypothetical protein
MLGLSSSQFDPERSFTHVSWGSFRWPCRVRHEKRSSEARLAPPASPPNTPSEGVVTRCPTRARAANRAGRRVERRGLIPLCELLHINGTYLLSTGVDYRSLRGTCWTLPSLAAALADTPDELEPLVRMKVRFRASRSPTRTARTVAIGAHGVARRSSRIRNTTERGDRGRHCSRSIGG